ncbi:MAG: radical SAM protein [Polyangiales bacterium]
MRALLINPPPRQRVDQFDTPDFGRVGLAYLAAMLRRRGDIEVAIVDARLERLRHDEVLRRARTFRPDLVGVTAFTNEVRSAGRVARGLKRALPGVITVLGGPHVSALPERTLEEFPEFDLGVVGEGEHTLDELARALAASAPVRGIPGLVYRRDGAPWRSAERDNEVDLDVFPRPAWDLLPRAPRALLVTQRGCPYACNFCENPAGRRVRQHSVARVLSDIEWLLSRHRVRELLVCDEIFTVDARRSERLLDAMIAAGVGRRVRWWAQTHVNTASRALFEKMRAAGCYRVGLGVETGDADAMRAMHKGITRERVLAARRVAAEAGLAVEGLFILGHPNETWASAMRTVDFAVALNPEVPVFSTMVPYPGTEVARMAARGEGGYRLLSRNWDDYINQIGHSLAFERLTRREMEAAQLLGYLKVFAANGRWSDLARFAWTYRSEGAAVARKLLSGAMPPPAEPDDVDGPYRRTSRDFDEPAAAPARVSLPVLS